MEAAIEIAGVVLPVPKELFEPAFATVLILNVPALIVTAPLNVFAPVKIQEPVPDLVTVPVVKPKTLLIVFPVVEPVNVTLVAVPEIAPANVNAPDPEPSNVTPEPVRVQTLVVDKAVPE